MKLAALDSLTWEGHGGHHWMGKIHHPDGTHELIRKLSRSEAKALSYDEDSRFWPKETERYETEADLEWAALKWCEKNLGQVWLLLDNDVDNPNPVIGSKGYSEHQIDRINNYEKWWWEQTESYREANWKQGYRIWRKLLEPA